MGQNLDLGLGLWVSDLGGAISAKDAKLMEEAIEDCERIDSNGW